MLVTLILRKGRASIRMLPSRNQVRKYNISFSHDFWFNTVVCINKIKFRGCCCHCACSCSRSFSPLLSDSCSLIGFLSFNYCDKTNIKMSIEQLLFLCLLTAEILLVKILDTFDGNSQIFAYSNWVSTLHARATMVSPLKEPMRVYFMSWFSVSRREESSDMLFSFYFISLCPPPSE